MRFSKDATEMMLEVSIPEQVPLEFHAKDEFSQSEGKLRLLVCVQCHRFFKILDEITEISRGLKEDIPFYTDLSRLLQGENILG